MMYEAAKFLLKVYYKLRFKMTFVGADRVPSTGPVMLCSNHVSDFDPPLIGIGLKRQLSFFAKKELFELPVIGKVFPSLNAIPVSRGKSDRSALKTSINALKEDRCLLISRKEAATKATSENCRTCRKAPALSLRNPKHRLYLLLLKVSIIVKRVLQ